MLNSGGNFGAVGVVLAAEDDDVFQHLREDIQTIFTKDPAARSLAEVLTYAGFWALFHHRIAHTL